MELVSSVMGRSAVPHVKMTKVKDLFVRPVRVLGNAYFCKKGKERFINRSFCFLILLLIYDKKEYNK